MADKMQRGFGFDPSVCESCPHHEEREKGVGPVSKTYMACGLCGCPTAAGMPMDRFGMPPADCPRLDMHEGR